MDHILEYFGIKGWTVCVGELIIQNDQGTSDRTISIPIAGNSNETKANS
jgi:hypothetical protein